MTLRKENEQELKKWKQTLPSKIKKTTKIKTASKMRTTEGESLFWLGYDNFMFSHSWFISLCRIISKATGVLTYFYFRLFVSIVEVFHQTIILFHFISHFGANFMFNIIFSFEAIIIFEVIFIFQVILIFEVIFIRGKGLFQGILYFWTF